MKMHKEMTNVEIAELLRAIAAAYEIKGKDVNNFRIIAYERAADAVEHLSSEAKDLWDDEKLDEISGIGKSISTHLGEIFTKGKSKHFEEILSDIPDAVFELLPIEGVGPSRAYKLVKSLDIKAPGSIKKLLRKAQSGEVAKLEGFGEDSEKGIIVSIKEVEGREKRLLLNYAEQISGEIIEWLKSFPEVIRADTLGSLRRKASTVGDIDISIASNFPEKSVEHFTKYPKANRVIEKGDRTASIIIPGNIQVDLMVQNPYSYGSLLQHFTGSKHHNIALREYALKKEMSLSEYGIKRKLKGYKNQKLKKFEREEDFYHCLGMEWIPPELREDTGEIEVSLIKSGTGGLPELIGFGDVKSDLQIHSDFNIETSHDLGESSYDDIVKTADSLGYEYIAFTEHNPSQRGHSNKDILELLKRKKESIDKLNYSLNNDGLRSGNMPGMQVKKVFNSLEIDILPNFKLSIPEEGLKLLDFALISIHSSFRQDRKAITQRVLEAMDHPNIKIFAHPTARKLNEREGIDLDWEKIFEKCISKNIWLEINADPMRLDLPDYLVKEAVKREIKLTLGTDSHHIDQMKNMKYGVYVARRGWATKYDIVNTYDLKDFEKMLK